MVNFGPLAAEIVSLVWGTPANFNGFRILAALPHGTLVVGVSQTAAFNRGRQLYSAGRPSGWALAHISSWLWIGSNLHSTLWLAAQTVTRLLSNVPPSSVSLSGWQLLALPKVATQMASGESRILERCNPWPHVANRHISISQPPLSLWRHSQCDVIRYWDGHAHHYLRTYVTDTLPRLIYKDMNTDQWWVPRQTGTCSCWWAVHKLMPECQRRTADDCQEVQPLYSVTQQWTHAATQMDRAATERNGHTTSAYYNQQPINSQRIQQWNVQDYQYKTHHCFQFSGPIAVLCT